MQLQAPRELGPYRILRELGAGGMAETFVAERVGPGGFVQQVCLKCIRPDMAGNPEFVRQFLVEAQILANLQHATLVQVLDFGRSDGQYYLALELVRGCDLGVLLNDTGRLEPAICLHLAIELATALGVAHRGGVVHRDVSPSNVLLNAEGEVKLTDFGLAKSESSSSTHRTVTGVIKGKVPYMAPEYAQTGRYGPRCDLFSLGVVLFECLVGRRPYDGPVDTQTMARAAAGQHDPLERLAPKAPEGLRRAVAQLLRPDPQERPVSAGALVEQLLDVPADPRIRRRIADLVGRYAEPDDDESAEGARRQATIAHESGERVLVQAGRLATGTTAPDASPSRRTPWFVGLGALAGLGVWAVVGTQDDGRVSTDSTADRLAATIPSDARTTPELGAAAPTGSVVASPGEMPAGADEVLVGAEGADDGQVAREAAVPQGGIALGEARTDRAASVAGQKAGKRSSASLTVVVVPYGDVTIDGKSYGRAPVTVRLPPGTHQVVAEGHDRRVTRTLKLAPKQRKRVVLE